MLEALDLALRSVIFYNLFCWDCALPEGTPEGVEVAGKVIDGRFEAGFDCYGVPMGTNKYISSELMVKAEKIVADADKTKKLLASNKQALWSALRLSIVNRFQYLCQHVPQEAVGSAGGCDWVRHTPGG